MVRLINDFTADEAVAFSFIICCHFWSFTTFSARTCEAWCHWVTLVGASELHFRAIEYHGEGIVMEASRFVQIIIYCKKMVASASTDKLMKSAVLYSFLLLQNCHGCQDDAIAWYLFWIMRLLWIAVWHSHSYSILVLINDRERFKRLTAAQSIKTYGRNAPKCTSIKLWANICNFNVLIYHQKFKTREFHNFIADLMCKNTRIQYLTAVTLTYTVPGHPYKNGWKPRTIKSSQSQLSSGWFERKTEKRA